jgi:hypothetical protein
MYYPDGPWKFEVRNGVWAVFRPHDILGEEVWVSENSSEEGAEELCAELNRLYLDQTEPHHWNDE